MHRAGVPLSWTVIRRMIDASGAANIGAVPASPLSVAIAGDAMSGGGGLGCAIL